MMIDRCSSHLQFKEFFKTLGQRGCLSESEIEKCVEIAEKTIPLIHQSIGFSLSEKAETFKTLCQGLKKALTLSQSKTWSSYIFSFILFVSTTDRKMYQGMKLAERYSKEYQFKQKRLEIAVRTTEMVVAKDLIGSPYTRLNMFHYKVLEKAPIRIEPEEMYGGEGEISFLGDLQEFQKSLGQRDVSVAEVIEKIAFLKMQTLVKKRISLEKGEYAKLMFPFPHFLEGWIRDTFEPIQHIPLMKNPFLADALVGLVYEKIKELALSPRMGWIPLVGGYACTGYGHFAIYLIEKTADQMLSFTQINCQQNDENSFSKWLEQNFTSEELSKARSENESWIHWLSYTYALQVQAQAKDITYSTLTLDQLSPDFIAGLFYFFLNKEKMNENDMALTDQINTFIEQHLFTGENKTEYAHSAQIKGSCGIKTLKNLLKRKLNPLAHKRFKLFVTKKEKEQFNQITPILDRLVSLKVIDFSVKWGKPLAGHELASFLESHYNQAVERRTIKLQLEQIKKFISFPPIRSLPLTFH